MEKTAEQLRREHIALEGDTHGKNKWAILFTVLIMTFMVCLDSTVVTVALPVMQKELGVGLERIQLVSSVYLLATCVAMLPFGRLGDVRGKVNVFQLGVIVLRLARCFVAFRPRSRFLFWHALFRVSVARRPWLTTWALSPSRFRRANEAVPWVFSRLSWPSA